MHYELLKNKQNIFLKELTGPISVFGFVSWNISFGDLNIQVIALDHWVYFNVFYFYFLLLEQLLQIFGLEV